MKRKRQVVDLDKLYKIIDDATYKFCSKCEDYKPMNKEYFHVNKTNKRDGFYPYCKPCNSKRSRQWEIDNPEKYKEANKRKIKSNDPLRRLRSKIAAEKNRREGYQREWRKNNTNKVKASNEKYREKQHIISAREWEACKNYFNHCCAYCGLSDEEHKRRYNKQLHKEHVVHDGSVFLDNCVPSCQSCNSSKSEQEVYYWFKYINIDNYTEEREEKIKQWLTNDYKDFFEGYRERRKHKNIL
ncbi:HNH endonuclease [Paenibacillus lactis]|uniref:HNH endonuclease n=1 Tax=Paenibacillus lactis TaxID=228574 RepID=UPI003D711220